MKKLFLIAMVGLSLALIIVEINFVISDFLIDNLHVYQGFGTCSNFL